MRAVLPGKPRAKLQAVCTAYWDDRRLIVSKPCISIHAHLLNVFNTNLWLFVQSYITGNAIVILTGPESILQTIYDDDEAHLDAIALDELSGKIATCAGSSIRVYKPYGQGEDALKVGRGISQPPTPVPVTDWS